MSRQIFLAFSLLFLLAFAGCLGQQTGAGEEELPPQMKAELETLLSNLVSLSANGQDVSVTIINAQPMDEFFNLTVSIDGQPTPLNVYVTKDGKYLVLGQLAEVKALKKEVEKQLKALKEGIPINFNIEPKGPAKGNEGSPVKVVEFSDFQCPFCYRFWQNTLPSIMENYGQKIAFYYRHFPLNFHPAAMPSAIASYCAQQQGKFWEYHDKLFENHDALGQKGTQQDFYLSLAEELGLDTEAFAQCLNSDASKAYVNEDFSAGQQYGVSGTPTFFIVVDKSIPKDKVVKAFSYIRGMGAKLYITPDGYAIMFSGALPYEVWDKVLSELVG